MSKKMNHYDDFCTKAFTQIRKGAHWRGGVAAEDVAILAILMRGHSIHVSRIWQELNPPGTGVRVPTVEIYHHLAKLCAMKLARVSFGKGTDLLEWSATAKPLAFLNPYD